MASNYSAYHPQNSQHPQYVYYAPGLARHPNSPSYYYAPAVPMQPLPVGQLHPRSRSFNDLYYPQHAQHLAPAGPHNMVHPGVPPAMPAMPVVPAVPAVPSSAASVDHPNLTRINSATSQQSSSPSVGSQSISSQPATNQPMAPGTPAAAGSKPLRYRGRMARSKSHSSLLVPNAAPNVPMAEVADHHAPAGLPAGAVPHHGRRMSSTSSLHRKNYSASMSSTEGSSTPSIMSTADTDSLTTQTSVSSTSSVDDEAKVQKFNYARRRSVADSNTLAQSANAPMEDRDENEQAPSAETAEAAEAVETTETAVPVVTISDDRPSNSTQKADDVAREGSADAKNPAVETAVAELRVDSVAPSSAQAEPAGDDGVTSAALAANTADLADSDRAASTVSESPASKAPISRIPIKQSQPQASEASQARQASVKPARSAKENLKETIREEEDIDPKDTGSRLDERALEIARQRPKRATMATPPKLVLPSDLQPRSYYQTTSGSESRHSLTAPRHARSASWYTGAPVSAGSAAGARDSVLGSEAADEVAARPRTPSAQSVSAQSVSSADRPRTASSDSDSLFSKQRSASAESDSSSARSRTVSAQSDASTPGSPVFLRRSYASRQRPAVQSLPPRRPDSVLGAVQPNTRHPLPRQPSATSSLDQRRASIASTASAAAAPALAPARRASAGAVPVPAPAPAPAPMPAAGPAGMRTAGPKVGPAGVPAPAAAASPGSAPLPSPAPKVRTSRSFGSRLKGMFSKDKAAEQSADDVSDTSSIMSTRSTKSSLSVRSASSGLSSLSSRFRRKKGSADAFEAPVPPAPAMTRRSTQESVSPIPSLAPLPPPTFRTQSATPSPTEPAATPRPPSPSLGSIGRQVAPNLTAGDIYPGLLRPNEVDTIISSLERTGSFERKLSTSRRSKEEKVPDEQVIRAPEPVVRPGQAQKPLKSALRSGPSKPGQARHIGFAQNTLVYNTYSAADYNRRPEPLPYNFRDRRVVTQLYRELNDVKLNMQVHPDSRHHTVYVFDPNERYLRALQS